MIKQNGNSSLKFLSIWAFIFFCAYIAVWFLHEVAHGFGHRLEGTHVSTGFNLVGASGKKPSDADFKVDLPIEGMSTGVLLGPFTNWMLAILFTGVLLHRSSANRSILIIGAFAVANAFMRLLPLAIFFIATILGNSSGVWQDEQQMSLGMIESISLPISDNELQELRISEPSIFLDDPGFYFWPVVSIIISFVCYVLAYRYLFKLFGDQLHSRAARLIFGLMPIIMFIPVFGVVNLLDNIIRINW